MAWLLMLAVNDEGGKGVGWIDGGAAGSNE